MLLLEQSHLPASASKRPFYGYVIVVVAFLIMMVTYGTLYTFGIFLKPLVAEFGWTRAMTSMAYSLSVFLHGLSYIVMGRLSDKFGPRVVLTIIACFLGMGYLSMSRVTAIWQLYLFYGIFIAIGISGYVPLVSTVAKWFAKARGMMTGIVLAGAGVGAMIVPPMAEWLISNHGWRASFAIIGITALVLMSSAAQLLKRSPGQAGQRVYGAEEGIEGSGNMVMGGFSFPQSVRLAQFWLLIAALFSQRFTIQAIMVHIVPHAIDQGIPALTAASVLTIIGGVSLGGRIVIGVLGDRIGNRRVLGACFILMSLALFLLVFIRENWILYIFAATFGFIYGGMYTLGSPMAAELFGLRSLGLIFGVVSFGGTVGGAVGPTLAGYIFDIRGSYQLAFLSCGIISVIGLIAVVMLKPVTSIGGNR